MMATGPTALVTPDMHIGFNIQPSPYIPTSKDFATAARHAGKGGTVIVINGAAIPRKLDYSGGSFNLSEQSNYYAIRDKEVFVLVNIPSTAFVGKVQLPSNGN
jgi:hypothetical protein